MDDSKKERADNSLRLLAFWISKMFCLFLWGELPSEDYDIVARFSEVSPIRPDTGSAPSTIANPR